MDLALSLSRSIAHAFHEHIVDAAMPRIRLCVELLDEEQVWRRHGQHGNSIGNLLLHLEGNVRQWILCGIGGEPDRRERDAEFAASHAVATPSELLDRLEATTVAAALVVDHLTPAQMVERRTFQGRFERDVAGAVLHVLEHFCGHAYQVYAWTKEMQDVDLKFFDL